MKHSQIEYSIVTIELYRDNSLFIYLCFYAIIIYLKLRSNLNAELHMNDQ